MCFRSSLINVMSDLIDYQPRQLNKIRRGCGGCDRDVLSRCAGGKLCSTAYLKEKI